ncbi:MAG: cytochrome C oxidase subunit I [Crocinitomix sp.]|nr:cytochrome C oxidase subunit I [Crocinitomix sp.]
MTRHFPLLFIALGLVALVLGSFIGLLISFTYLDATFLKEIIPFNQLRPLHTTTVVSWIVLGATGGVYYYLSQIKNITIYAPKLGFFHFILFALTGVAIYISLLSGRMGGREYLEYFPLLTIPILVGWILFGFNYFKSLFGKIKNRPVYLWMWGTGIVFMVYHLSEAHFWIFSDIRSDFIKDMGIQWKSYGSFFGSWNMLIYGTAIYLMSKIKKDENVARGKTVFFFYFLGLTNLMFGWAHHTYILPNADWIRYVAYVISMTEWIILIHIIYAWAKSLSKAQKKENSMAYRFLMASEFWVFVNLILALLMSIPALNYYMHGTHITVAHSMGTTIGINTCILLASVSYIVKIISGPLTSKTGYYGFILFNISLAVFWLSLVIGGVYKAVWMSNPENLSFSTLHSESTPIFWLFFLSGCALFIGITMISAPLLKRLYNHMKLSKEQSN